MNVEVLEWNNLIFNSHLAEEKALNWKVLIKYPSPFRCWCDFEDSLRSEIPEEHIKQFRTVGEVVEYLEKVV
ncbi:hypothetical protein E4K67_05670 [Desulfosporosinus fructosivorans]|uniref:Uncharacterized protein n=1 Tax=Desulfosporosinus fructosivorans TaxID=2018669 RepID=A0A4Z0R9K2_9FIRM|nr:hypothetical protein [Desulfosporosinus fructosivorans]TGE38959.1 hypothetical protein E4K67_05670 [Desulfosporosinus fructosivorans]